MDDNDIDKPISIQERNMTLETKEADQELNKKGTNDSADISQSTTHSFDEKHDYELIDNVYYYTDSTSGTRYSYNEANEKWEVCDSTQTNNFGEVTTDEEGRQYYYVDGKHICRDPLGNSFYYDENHEWKPWSDLSVAQHDKNEKHSNDNHWYFYRGNHSFYRDNSTNKVYKLQKETNIWELYERRNKKKRKPNSDEEFDSDDERDEDDYYYSDDEENGDHPPGYKSDPNISYNGENYSRLDPSDNMIYDWDTSKKAWFPKIDEDFMASYQLSYGFNPDGTKNENPLKFDDDDDAIDHEKEKEEEKKKDSSKTEKKQPGWFDMDDAHNTKVYVSNLPTDMTEENLVDFMQKCGLLLKDLETQKFKIKLYKDKDGNFKGDALCTYIKKESVELALQILDGYHYGSNVVKVERAKFTLKGEYNPSLKPKKKRKKDLEKLQKKQEKMFDWRPDPLRGQRMKHENVAILRNVFDPKEFERAAERILIHTEGIRNMAEAFGPVKKVELFDRHPEGVVKVTFVDVESADMCVATINNRLYLKRKLVVATWDGSEKYNIEETEEQRAERIRKWEEFLATGK